MKLVDFIHLSPRVKLYRNRVFTGGLKQFYTKGEVRNMIISQITDDVLSQVSKREIKERVINLLDKYEPVPPRRVLKTTVNDIINELKL